MNLTNIKKIREKVKFIRENKAYVIIRLKKINNLKLNLNYLKDLRNYPN